MAFVENRALFSHCCIEEILLEVFVLFATSCFQKAKVYFKQWQLQREYPELLERRNKNDVLDVFTNLLHALKKLILLLESNKCVSVKYLPTCCVLQN